MMGVVTTVLSGALLYARYLAAGISFMWTTHAGLAFTVGTLAALASYVIGVTIYGSDGSRAVSVEK